MTSAIAEHGVSMLLGGVSIDYLLNGLFPFRAGELLKAQYIVAYRKSAALSTIIIERMFDIVLLGICLLPGLWIGKKNFLWIKTVAR